MLKRREFSSLSIVLKKGLDKIEGGGIMGQREAQMDNQGLKGTSKRAIVEGSNGYDDSEETVYTNPYGETYILDAYGSQVKVKMSNPYEEAYGEGSKYRKKHNAYGVKMEGHLHHKNPVDIQF